jgi:tripartite-type tricarboxylate transporter receptor subunit TctC
MELVCSKGPKDGYTMLSYNVPHFIAQSIVFKTKYNIHTFAPVANWGADPAVLIVGKESPFNTVQDLVEYAKQESRQGDGQWSGSLCGAPHRLSAIVQSHGR